MDVLSAPNAVAGAQAGARHSLSVVVPVYNEEAVLPEFHRRLAAVLDGLPVVDAEIVYVNDGSTDRTLALLEELHRADARVAVIDLSRNFGKEVAMSAGLDQARGDAVVVIDADLQDPPELIPDMIAAWRTGYDVVLMRRRIRAQETWLK
jgi:glycosyltransferase involved in cell wall biosynthesis